MVITDVDGESTKIKAALPLKVKVIEKPQMSEINPGVWDGLTPDQAKKFYPEEWARFVKDPYAFRAPRAESYHDLSGIILSTGTIFILIISFGFSSSGTHFNRTRT
jgi:6-phosphofructo-2-kinase/fructose-2,6-biphosphatase 4